MIKGGQIRGYLLIILLGINIYGCKSSKQDINGKILDNVIAELPTEESKSNVINNDTMNSLTDLLANLDSNQAYLDNTNQLTDNNLINSDLLPSSDRNIENRPRMILQSIDPKTKTLVLRPVKEKIFSGKISFGHMYDTNANFAPSKSVVDFFNNPINLTETQRQQSDNAFLTSALGRYKKSITEKIDAEGSLYGNIVDYNNINKSNNGVLIMQHGLTFKFNQNMNLFVPLDYSRISLGDTDPVNELFYTYGTSPSFIFKINQNWVYQISGSMTNRVYSAGTASEYYNNDRNSRVYGASNGIIYINDKSDSIANNISLRFSTSRENAVAEYWSNRSNNITLSYKKRFFSNKLVFFAMPMITWYKYDQANPAFSSDPMKLTTQSINITSEYYFTKNFFTSFGYVYSKNDSNIDFFTFNRQLFITKFGYEF